MSKTFRVGLIGCGGMARAHLKNLQDLPGVRVAALTDPSEEMVAETRRRFPALAEAPLFADYRRMLARAELDGVIVSSPHTVHYRQVIDSLKAGLHVLCDKPMVCSLADARKVAASARRARRAVVVSYQRRFVGMRKFVRQFIRDRSFGRPLIVQSFLSQEWLRAQRGTWRQDPALSGGGQLNDSGSHIVDMIFWTMPSRPVAVSAMIENRGAPVDIDSAVTYRFADGCLGSLVVLGAGPGNVFWEDMTVIGSGGRGVFLRNGVLTVSTGSEIAEYRKFAGDQTPEAHWLEVIRGRATNESPPEGFLPTIAFTEACWRSARHRGRPVAIRY